ncbi:MAG: hypothetical protein N2745_11750, partial [Syntrophorhabdaceae bacterium]|nr:hypothetical protein [Syntrophorhabdaceae bacterium]
MWRIAYNILLSILFPLFLLFSLTKRKIRKNLLERLFFSTKDYRIRDAIWIHAASVGEAAIGETLIEYMKSIKDISNFIVTTNTFYTKDMLKNRFKGQIAVFSLPFDFLWSVRHFINGSTFSALILIETEIWPNIIWEAKRKGIPVLIVNGRISDSTIKTYTRLSFFIRHVLSFVDFAICQSEEHKRRFISIGMNPAKTVTTGNLKYYRGIKETDREAKKERVITFGSIKEKELDTIYSVVRRLKENFPEYRVYIAPRDLFLVSNLEKELSPQFKTVKYSTLKEERDAPLDIVIVDTVGNLLEIYKKSEVAFVGGSLAPYGGQNMLE